MKHVFRVVLGLGLSLGPSHALAQSTWPVGVEFVVGPGRGFSINDDVYRGNRTGAYAALLGTLRLHAPEQGGLIAGLELGGYFINVYELDDCVPARGGGCVPYFPDLGGVSLLGGWETQSTKIRMLGGLGIVDPEYDRTIGITSRVDLALPLVLHISAVATGTSLFVPSWNGDGFYYFAFGRPATTVKCLSRLNVIHGPSGRSNKRVKLTRRAASACNH